MNKGCQNDFNILKIINFYVTYVFNDISNQAISLYKQNHTFCGLTGIP